MGLADREIYTIRECLLTANPRAAADLFPLLPHVHSYSAMFMEEIFKPYYADGAYNLGVIIQFLRLLPNPMDALHGCTVLHHVDKRSHTSKHRQHSLALPFFVYELTGTIPPGNAKARADECWNEWFPTHVKAIVMGREIHIKNVKHKELFYAAADDLKFDSERRNVFTWKGKWAPGVHETDVKWRILPGNEEKSWFYLVNVRHNEYFYAAMFDRENHGERGLGYAFTWCNGHPGDQARWEFHQAKPRGKSAHKDQDVYALFNPNQEAYLYASDDMYSPERRRTLMWRRQRGEKKLKARKWRLIPARDENDHGSCSSSSSSCGGSSTSD